MSQRLLRLCYALAALLFALGLPLSLLLQLLAR